MNHLYHSVRTGIVLCVVVIALSGAVSAAHSASITADPMEGGESSKHLVTVTVDESSAGPLRGLEVDYRDSGANPGQLQSAGVTIGIDRDDDDPGRTVDDEIEDLQEVASDSEGLLTLRFEGSHTVEAGDEIVARFVFVQNPATAGDYQTAIDVNPETGGGTTAARLQIGTNRATVLIDDQTTTGETVTVDSVNLPSGGFVVLHDEEALGTGASDPDAITEASVVGASAYLSAGTHEDVEVELTESVESGEQYLAMTVKDDGSEAYETSADGPYLVRGNPIWEPASFTVRESTATATETEIPADDGEEGGDQTEAAETESTETARNPETDEPATTSGSSPGFGVTLAILALVGAVCGLARRRDR
jgi:PGF-CTERM protein